MKKTIKLFAALFLVIAICLSLTGCQFIDDMRKTQAFWTDDGIRFRGAEYVALPECETLDPIISSDLVYVTKADVPVLLCEVLGDWADVSEDGIFVITTEKNYCRKDKYDEVCAKITNGAEFDTYCCGYYEYDDDTYTSELTYARLSKAEIDAINQTMTKGKKQSYDDFEYDEYTEELSIELRSSDLFFYGGTFDIIKDKRNYYVVDYSADDVVMRVAPKSLAPIFKELFIKYESTY